MPRGVWSGIAPPSWSAPGVLPQLRELEVHVWKASVAAWAACEWDLRPVLATEERARASRFRFAKDRQQFVVARALLRSLLAHYIRLDRTKLRFQAGPAGKPSVILPAGSPPVEFNVSHSDDIVLIAITTGFAVGVDVERWVEGVEFIDLIQWFFSASEGEQFRLLAPEQRQSSFFACWARKEAYIKATGLGVSAGLDYFDVTVAADRPAHLLADRRDPKGWHRWRLLDLDVGPGYSGALVAEGHAWVPRRYMLDPRAPLPLPLPAI